MKVYGHFRVATASATDYTDPTVLSAISRPFAGGATIEDFGSVIANRLAAGVFWVEVNEALYTAATPYEVYWTMTLAGHHGHGLTTFEVSGTVPTAPAAPSLSAVNDGDGNSLTATVTGVAGVTYEVYRRTPVATAWTLAGSRVGSGAVAVGGLTEGWYDVVAVGKSGGVYGLPSAVVGVYVELTAATEGPFASALANLKELLARSARWQSWCGAAGTEAERIAHAKTHIAEVEEPDPLTTPHPYAVMTESDSWRAEAFAIGAGQTFLYAGELLILFHANKAAGQTASVAERTFKNAVGVVIQEMCELAGTDTLMFLQSLGLEGIRHADPDELAEGGYIEALVRGRWPE